jgi:Protein of unknown function (DUF3606)
MSHVPPNELQDWKRVPLTQEYKLKYWTETLGVSKERLVELVKAHGSSVARIRQVLGHSALAPFSRAQRKPKKERTSKTTTIRPTI